MLRLFIFACLQVGALMAAGPPDNLPNGFSLGRTYPAEVGTTEATVWCAASSTILARECEMSAPSGLILTLSLDTGAVVSGSEEMTGYSAYSDPSGRVCGLTIKTVGDQDLGEWKCKISPPDGSHYQEGTISLLTDEQGFVRDMRLPRHVIPEAYNLSLTPFIIPDNYTIQGSITLSAVTQEADNKCDNKCIVLHSLDTEILEESLAVVLDGFQLEVVGVGYDYDREFLIVYTAETLSPGLSLTLHIDFISILNDNLAGFYRSSYFDPLTNTTKTMATTQFESTDSRRAFPSLDEPSLKAVFTVSLGRLPSMISLSNMRLTASLPHPTLPDYVLDEYETTVKMSTYLLAFIVCEFESTHAVGRDNFNIWAPKARIADLGYAAEIGPRITDYYGELFDYDFPLAKMDMAAIPDFQSGAMENWGLITYRDSNLFYNEKDFAESNRMRVSVVVAHELAHQWFGDLVTMKWWNDLWLNEGFASYVEYLGTDFVAPEMAIRQQVVNIDLHDVFYLDSLPSSHPISTVIDNPTYQDNFDRISYGKGSVLIRMMEDFLTTKSFFAALGNYFKTYAYANAEQDDLWQAYDDQAHADGVLPPEVNVKTIMDTWTLLKGYPVVNVRRISDTAWNISQTKFNLEVGAAEEEDPTWWVPVTFKHVADQAKTTFWLSERSTEVAAPASLADNLFVFNVDQMGYYRVNYDEDTWAQLSQALSSLSNINRAGLVDDALNLARAGQLGYTTALELTRSLAGETDYITLTATNTALKFLDLMLRHEEEYYPSFRAHVATILQAAYDQVSVDDSAEFLSVARRSLVMGWSCYLGNEDCRQKADQQFQAWKLADNFENSINPNDKPWVLCSGIRGGTEEDWELAWTRLQTTQVLSERFALYTALACTGSADLINRYLERSIDPSSTIRNQDMRYVYTAIGDSEGRGGELMLTWLEDNYDAIRTHYAETFVYNVKNMLLGFPEEAVTTADYDRLAAFLSAHRADLSSAAVTIQQGLDKIAANIKWRQNFFDDATGWLSSYY